VVDANQRIIEDVVTVAIAGAKAGVEPPPGSSAEHPPFVDAGDPDDGFVADPQGIARPWEPDKRGTE